MNNLQRLLGVGAIALATAGTIGCATVEEQKYRSITEFIPDNIVETRVVDINKDGHLDMVYLTRSKKGDYLLKIMKANNNGSFRNPETLRSYERDPRTLNFLTYFYYDISKVIEGKIR